MAKPNKAANKSTEMPTDGGAIGTPEDQERTATLQDAAPSSPDTPPDAPPAREEPTDPPAQETTAEAPAMEIGPMPIRKINPKDVMGKKMKEVEVPEKGIYDLFTIIGTAVNLRDGESAFGPWTALVGEFEAVRLSDGQRYTSTQCFVPGAAGELLVTQVRKFILEEIPVTPEQFKKIGKTYKVTGETAEMALIVGIKKAQRDGGADYEYVIRPVVPVQKSDTLGVLRNQLKAAITGGGLTLMLPPPKPVTPPTTPALDAPKT